MRRVRHREVTFKLTPLLVLLPPTVSSRGSFSSESLTAFPESDALTPKDKIDGGTSLTSHPCARTHTGIPTYLFVAILHQST